MKSLLETLARELVDDPGLVAVTQWDEEGGIYLELEVAPGDRGLVIGKRGRTADALRTVLDAVARRRETSCEMEIVD